MVATYKEWSELMAEMSSSDAKANREKRLKAYVIAYSHCHLSNFDAASPSGSLGRATS
jgi:hypothetical protein